jgi:hypothetical protein
MKSTIKKRLQNIEKTLKISHRHRCALIICDPDILHTFVFSSIDADYRIILPDNGLRMEGDPPIPKGSFTVSYS